MDSRRGLSAFAIVFLSVAAEIVLAGARLDPQLRPVLITAIVGLAAISVAVSVFWSMGLAWDGWGLRLVIAVPLALSVALAVVLILETHHRARVEALVATGSGG